ncbi:hypothetical protein AAIA72_02065 [Hahella sp. SMD15-11]|uniref:Thiamin/hydroxymethyl pyrimidine-binding YkoF putative domain-containing protein n=1 Tax=Thermohahella caldifontis TaxID=3142973 RepID=A0AB39UX84_9GAMM
MLVSAELSFYPLQDDFAERVRKVIARLQSFPDIEVLPNRISTQVFGEFDAVNHAVSCVMKESFAETGHAVFVIKWLGTDRRPRPDKPEYQAV